MAAVLEMKDVELSYGNVAALRSVSLTVNAGETVALIGANGAGKSSILRAITGLARPKAGTITFRGESLLQYDAARIVAKGIAMVPEGRRVFPYMSVKDNLLMGAFTRTGKTAIRQRLASVLERFPRLSERFGQMAGTLSGGEQQMLVIGRALMAAPELLLLDEPSLGIAPKLVQTIAKSIIAISRDENVSVLLVEQNSKMALSISNRAYALATGEVVLSGDSRKLSNDPKVKAAYLGGGV